MKRKKRMVVTVRFEKEDQDLYDKVMKMPTGKRDYLIAEALKNSPLFNNTIKKEKLPQINKQLLTIAENLSIALSRGSAISVMPQPSQATKTTKPKQKQNEEESVSARTPIKIDVKIPKQEVGTSKNILRGIYDSVTEEFGDPYGYKKQK